MVFNTGAALLDAIVLAVVSKEPQGTYGLFIRCCAAFRRMTAWRYMIRPMPDGTADIIS